MQKIIRILASLPLKDTEKNTQESCVFFHVEFIIITHCQHGRSKTSLNK